MGSIDKRLLKAFVRFDGQGRVVVGSLILRKVMPKVGKWQEIIGYECCNYTTSTTSTTLNPEDCYTYLFINERGTASLTYTDCNGQTVGPTEYDTPQAITFCSNGDISYTGSSASVSYEGECTLTTTTTELPCNTLGDAKTLAVLGASTVTNTGTSVVVGDLGLSPGTSVTGFPPGIVTGTKYITDVTAAAALASAEDTFACLMLLGPATRLGAAIGGTTIYAGVYDFAASASITGTLTLNGGGDANAVFVFQIPTTLTTATSAVVTLTNGAQAGNVYWVVGTSATLGISSNISGNIIADQSITMNTSAALFGSAFALVAAVTLDTNVVVVQDCTVNACDVVFTTTTTSTTATPTTTSTTATPTTTSTTATPTTTTTTTGVATTTTTTTG